MKKPNFQAEKTLWRKGYKKVACLDEAGRGPLAGPVTAGAVAMLNTSYHIPYTGIRDSKKLSQKQREKFYNLITKDKNMEWGIGIVSEKIIDKINILEATKLAMQKAVKNLEKRSVKKSCSSRIFRRVDFLLLDGKMKINLPLPQKSIVKADEKVFSCAAASILAKVTRDRIMVKYHLKYPRYHFNVHKGYPTKLHRKLLRKYGPCKIHRKSFRPVRACPPKFSKKT